MCRGGGTRLTSMKVSAHSLERRVRMTLAPPSSSPTSHCSCQHSTAEHVCAVDKGCVKHARAAARATIRGCNGFGLLILAVKTRDVEGQSSMGIFVFGGTEHADP